MTPPSSKKPRRMLATAPSAAAALGTRRAPTRQARAAASAFAGNAGALRAPRALQPRCAARKTVTTMGLFGLGAGEIAVIAGVVAVIFGPSKLPDLGKSLGKTVKSFQGAAKVLL